MVKKEEEKPQLTKEQRQEIIVTIARDTSEYSKTFSPSVKGRLQKIFGEYSSTDSHIGRYSIGFTEYLNSLDLSDKAKQSLELANSHLDSLLGFGLHLKW